jgi:hypothetical protein
MEKTPELNFPDYQFSVRSEKGRHEIFDPARRKYVSLSPEEWVRQHIIQYLVSERNVPLSLIAVEYSLSYLGMSKRCDILVFNRQAVPQLLVECKAPTVILSAKTLEQIARYNRSFEVPYLLVSNGLSHYCFQVDHVGMEIVSLPGIPILEL